MLVGDLLDVSKIEAGKLELRHELIDLQRLTDELVEAIQATIAKHQILVEGTVSRHVVGDGERLGQVLTNLLTNAVKYSPQADRIIVRLAETPDGVTIEVQDFGIGIDPEHLDQVFDRFYRVTSEDEKTFPGLGMGLYISHEIVRRHGGTMEVTSVKGAAPSSASLFRMAMARLRTVPRAASDRSTVVHSHGRR